MNIKLVIDFLNNLRNNNNKIWFTEHKQEYLEIKNYISEITEKLINEISKFDSSIQYLTIPECTYRINRDLRFTKDKSPYKTHIGIFISPHGKKSCHAGYYCPGDNTGAWRASCRDWRKGRGLGGGCCHCCYVYHSASWNRK